MYEQGYVKKRKRRRAAVIIVGVGAVGVTALGIVSFLGRFVGTFTVSVSNGVVNLALSETADFAKPESLLRIDTLEKFEEIDYLQLPSADVLDNEETDYLHGANYTNGVVSSMNYFKYTFYLKNVGTKPATYNIKFNIVESQPSSDGTNRWLDDTVRVMIFDNDGYGDEHKYEVYAKEASEYNFLSDGTRTRKEFISVYPYDNTEDADHPLAEAFRSGSLITENTVANFAKNDMKRYTVVTWLEGYDPQSRDDMDPPMGASLKLGVEINAYEN